MLLQPLSEAGASRLLSTLFGNLTWEGISAVSTSGAVIVALLSLHHQRGREQRLQEDELDQQRRAQAGYISVWYLEVRHRIWVENRSEQPIYDVGVTFARPHPSAGESPYVPVQGICPVLPPHHRVQIFPDVQAPSLPLPVLAFRDAQGVTWRRDDQGNLTELAEGVYEYFGVVRGEGHQRRVSALEAL